MNRDSSELVVLYRQHRAAGLAHGAAVDALALEIGLDRLTILRALGRSPEGRRLIVNASKRRKRLHEIRGGAAAPAPAHTPRRKET
jgi:hypothetical protein